MVQAAQIQPPGTALIRDARDTDLPAIRDIYTPHVLHGLATFEEEPPDLAAWTERRAAVLAMGLPFLVLERQGRVLGYAYANTYRARPAYRWTLEDSIYLAPDQGGQGLGTALLGELLARCSAGPWRQMVAVIGHSGNLGSIAVHRRLGFQDCGTMRAVGFNLGQWVDTVMMQRELGLGASCLP